MKEKINSIKKHVRLLGLFAKYSLMSQLEYRINFISGLLVELAWMLIKLIYVAVIYRAGTNIGILTTDHILLFIGIYVLLTGFYMLFFGNFIGLAGLVQNGNLDLYIVKPISTQFYVTLKNLAFPVLLPNLIIGIIMICVGWSRAGLTVSIESVLGFCFYLISGLLLTYSLFLIPFMLCFWFISIAGVVNLTAAAWDFNNMPQLIYPKWFQRLGTFILPIFVATNFPGLFIMGELSLAMKIWGVVLPIIIFIISRFMWKRGLARYSSASS